MLKERRAAVEATATAFIATEESVEQSASLGARCIATIIEQRIAAKLPLETAAAPLQLITGAVHDLLAAREKMIAAHAMLREVPAQIGLTTVGYGDDGCPPNQGKLSDGPSLKVVA